MAASDPQFRQRRGSKSIPLSRYSSFMREEDKILSTYGWTDKKAREWFAFLSSARWNCNWSEDFPTAKGGARKQ